MAPRLEPARRETWPAERLRELKRRWQRGESERTIARALGCAASSVRLRVHRHGFTRSVVPPRAVYHPPLPDEVWREVQRLFEDGVPTDAISVECGVSTCRIYHRAGQQGWTRPPGWMDAQRAIARFDPSEEQTAWLEAQWAANAPLSHLADGLRVSDSTVRRLARRLGLPRRDRGAVLRARHDRDPFLSAARDQAMKIVRLYNAGLRSDEIAAVVGRTTEAIQSVLARARRRGEHVRHGCRPLIVTPASERTIRQGYRLGVGLATLVGLIDASEGWTTQRVCRTARRLGLKHRNADDPVRARLAPEQLMLEERAGRDPVNRVQALFRRHPSFTEKAALAALDDYAQALRLFPQLVELPVAKRGLKPTPYLRGPSPAIEARRGQYLCLSQEEKDAA